MKVRKIGNLTVSEVGMGCMAFSHGYGKIPDEQYSIEAIRGAFDHGCTFFDAAEVVLTSDELAALDAELSQLKVYGHRGFSR